MRGNGANLRPAWGLGRNKRCLVMGDEPREPRRRAGRSDDQEEDEANRRAGWTRAHALAGGIRAGRLRRAVRARVGEG